MKQTEQYGLNQWELSDRIRMEDFNADNLKIAEALAGKLGKVEVLYDTQTQATTTGAFMLPHLDWNQWSLAVLHFHYDSCPDAPGTTIESGILPNCGARAITVPSSHLFLLAPLHDASRAIQGLLLAEDTVRLFRGPCSFSEIYGFNFCAHPSGIFQGPGLAVYGIR